jgi:ribosome biogenesis GTPase A
MSHFGWVVHKLIGRADVILEVLDARFIDETRNLDLEEQIKHYGKVLIHVINKCDFLEQDELEKLKKKFENCVFVSAKRHFGTKMLKEKIMILAKQHNKKQPVVGVIGYPNVGKSSVINALSGSGSARTSPEAGFTKGSQMVRISKDLMMIDSPGVIQKEKQNEHDLALIGAKNPSTIQNPDLAVIKLMKKYDSVIQNYYGVDVRANKEKTIEDIAIKMNLKKKGNIPDIDRASKMILLDWQNGKIRKSLV